jgi:hypothetical protein
MGLRKKDETEIKLGEKYRDTTSGFEGTAVGRHEYLHGCTRITLQTLKDGDLKEFSFDAPALVAVETQQAFTSKRTGGPRPTPGARTTG